MKKNVIRTILLVMVVIMAMLVTGCSVQADAQNVQESIVNKYEGWEVIGINIEKSYTSGGGSRTYFMVAAIDTDGEFHAVSIEDIVIIESGATYLSYEIFETGLRGTKLYVTKDEYRALS